MLAGHVDDVHDHDLVLARGKPGASTDHLRVEQRGAGRAREQHRFDGRLVVAFGEHHAIGKHAQLAAAERVERTAAIASVDLPRNESRRDPGTDERGRHVLGVRNVDAEADRLAAVEMLAVHVDEQRIARSGIDLPGELAHGIVAVPQPNAAQIDVGLHPVARELDEIAGLDHLRQGPREDDLLEDLP